MCAGTATDRVQGSACVRRIWEDALRADSPWCLLLLVGSLGGYHRIRVRFLKRAVRRAFDRTKCLSGIVCDQYGLVGSAGDCGAGERRTDRPARERMRLVNVRGARGWSARGTLALVCSLSVLFNHMRRDLASVLSPS